MIVVMFQEATRARPSLVQLFTFTFIASLCVAISNAAEPSRFTSDYPIDDCQFSPFGGGPYFDLNPGRLIVLAGEEDGSSVVLEIETLDRTERFETVIGARERSVVTRVVEEREFIDGELTERAEHYYARCVATGDIYYFGEFLDAYENGEIVSHLGSWRAGEGGATAGIIMPGTFMLGARYFHQQAPGVVRDMAENVESSLTVESSIGTLSSCIRIWEYDGFKPETAPSIKVYAPGVGLVDDDEIIRIEELRLGTQGPPSGSSFTASISHPYFPAVPGTMFTYENGPDSRTISILESTRRIQISSTQSAETRAIEEQVFESGALVETIREFVGQCVETGDVFLFGREVIGGVSWLAGSNESAAVLKLPARPTTGAIFNTAHTSDRPQELSAIISNTAEIETPLRTFEQSLLLNVSSAEGGSTIAYAPGVGPVQLADGATLTNLELPPSSSEAPTLTIQPAVILSWPLGDQLFEVESSSDLSDWSRVDKEPLTIDGRKVLPLPHNASQKHFRLTGPDSP